MDDDGFWGFGKYFARLFTETKQSKVKQCSLCICDRTGVAMEFHVDYFRCSILIDEILWVRMNVMRREHLPHMLNILIKFDV